MGLDSNLPEKRQNKERVKKEDIINKIWCIFITITPIVITYFKYIITTIDTYIMINIFIFQIMIIIILIMITINTVNISFTLSHYHCLY